MYNDSQFHFLPDKAIVPDIKPFTISHLCIEAGFTYISVQTVRSPKENNSWIRGQVDMGTSREPWIININCNYLPPRKILQQFMCDQSSSCVLSKLALFLWLTSSYMGMAKMRGSARDWMNWKRIWRRCFQNAARSKWSYSSSWVLAQFRVALAAGLQAILVCDCSSSPKMRSSFVKNPFLWARIFHLWQPLLSSIIEFLSTISRQFIHLIRMTVSQDRLLHLNNLDYPYWPQMKNLAYIIAVMLMFILELPTSKVELLLLCVNMVTFAANAWSNSL